MYPQKTFFSAQILFAMGQSKSKVSDHKEKKRKKKKVRILPRRWVIRIVTKGKFAHLPLPNPNHPCRVQNHGKPRHPNHRVHQLQNRLNAASQHPHHFLYRFLICGKFEKKQKQFNSPLNRMKAEFEDGISVQRNPRLKSRARMRINGFEEVISFFFWLFYGSVFQAINDVIILF